MTSRRKLSAPLRIARHVVLCMSSAFILLPFAWMITTSLKAPYEIFQSPTLANILPSDWHTIENYSAVFTDAPMARFLLNGVVVCTGILLLQLLIAIPCAYALAKLRFPGRNAVFGMTIFGLLVPGQALVIPLYVLFHYLGLLDSYAGLILPHSISVFAIFLLRQFFMSTSDDFVHAARIDGMSELGIVARVMVPLALPALLAFSAFSLASHWNDLLWPIISVRSRDLATPPLGLVFFKTADQGTDYGHLMAAATVIVAPLALAFFLAQRWFISGMQVPTK
jgi:multiple sugar transport system permease protein